MGSKTAIRVITPDTGASQLSWSLRASIPTELAEGQYGIPLSELMLDSIEGKVGRESNPHSCWSLPWGRWEPPALAAGMCALWRAGSARDHGAAATSLLPQFPADQRHGETQVLSGCGAVAMDWDGNCATGACIHPISIPCFSCS